MSKVHGKRLFGTDGIRGVAGAFPLDDATVAIIGRALAEHLAAKLGRKPNIVIGRDTRESGPGIEHALREGAETVGARVESAGVITTPGVAYITRAISFDAGVVISASHNPFLDNGIKVFSPSGKKLADEAEREIEDAVDRARRSPSASTSRRVDTATDHPCYSESRYRNLYTEYLINDMGRGLELDGLTIGLDCANGAAYSIAPEVFKRLGARVEVISAEPDGRNINERCGSLHQDALQQLVVDRRLDLGVSFDGDADRALLVDARGLSVDGDQMMLILAARMKSRGELSGHIVVSTVMSNLGFEIALREKGIELIRAHVGDRYVLEELLARDASLGGEQSGHIIMPRISLFGDGIVTAIEVLRAVRESGRTLEDLASEMARLPQVLVNVRVTSKPRLETVPGIAATMQRIEEELGDRGRLLVRYSGTENLARVMIEGEDQATIEDQAEQIAIAIRSAIGDSDSSGRLR